MPFRSEVPGKPAHNPIMVRVHDEMLAFIDAERGKLPRAVWIRSLIRKEKQRLDLVRRQR